MNAIIYLSGVWLGEDLWPTLHAKSKGQLYGSDMCESLDMIGLIHLINPDVFVYIMESRSFLECCILIKRHYIYSNVLKIKIDMA